MTVDPAEAPAEERLDVPLMLPRGPHGLPPTVVALSQRRRLLDAIVAAVAEKGYSPTTVADVIRRAGVSRTTFYQQFADKEDCFLAAYRDGAQTHYELVRRARAAARHPLEQLRAGVFTYVLVLFARPEFTRSFLGEIVAAGPRALALREEAQQRYVALLATIHRELRRHRSLPEVDDELILAVTSAIDELIVRRVRDGELTDPRRLAIKALYMLLAVLGLHEEADKLLGEES